MKTLAALLLVGALQFAAANTPGVQPDLPSLKSSYEAAIARGTAPLVAGYRADLDSLKSELTTNGDLAGATLVDNELKAAPQTLPRTATKLQALKSAHETAVEHVTAPLKKIYIAELGRLKTALTRKGDLPAARAVDNEIKAMAPTAIRSGGPAVATLTKSELEQLLTSGKWSFLIDVGTRAEAIRGTATFKTDGSLKVSWNNPGGQWEITANGRLKYRPGTVWECVFTRVDDARFDGTSTGSAAAKNGRVRLVKLP